jgi:acyl-CoA reductase-like NAD-dependent aldehyde dehydrogenase
MIIGGKGVAAVSGKVMEILNPSTGKVIDTVPMADSQDVDKAIEVACRGRAIMRAMPAYKRSEILRKAADLIAKRQEELSQLLCAENGKTISASSSTSQKRRSGCEAIPFLWMPLLGLSTCWRIPSGNPWA